MDLMSWLPIAGLCFLGAASPGPSLAVVIRHTIRGSRKHGMITGLAHSFGVGIYALLTVSGLAALVALQPALQKGLAWTGGVYLAYLGYKALRSTGSSMADEGKCEISGLCESARDGLMISLLNPKLAIFFLALFSQFIAADMPRTTAVIMVLTAMLVDGIWYCIVASALSHHRFLDKLKKHAVIIDRFTGVILIALAIRVFTL